MAIELRTYQTGRDINIGDEVYYFVDSYGVRKLKIDRETENRFYSKGHGVLRESCLTKKEMLENLQCMNDLIIKSLLTMCYDD